MGCQICIRLGLNDSQITSIENGAFKGLSELETLYLWDNELTQLNLTGAEFDSLITCVPLRC